MYRNFAQHHGLSCDGEFAKIIGDPYPEMHFKCRSEVYVNSDVRRFAVPEDMIGWKVDFPAYRPTEFFAVQDPPIPEDPDFRKETSLPVQWNSREAKVDRRSHSGSYQIRDNVPLNPVGRTGVTGRGRLARWGPNHAADPVVTRWKRDGDRNRELKDGKPVLQFVAIRRGDTGEWALPGGFVDAGEHSYKALRREFGEEALDTGSFTDAQRNELRGKLDDLFAGRRARKLYAGYVDDPRNTDNSWMETCVVNFHDETGKLTDVIQLKAGDDAVGVQWKDLDSSLRLYASHRDFVNLAAKHFDCSW